jgi:tyrosyl-tRNA synthetase
MVAVQLVKFAKSNGEARRLIEGRGLRVNDMIVDSIMHMLTQNDLRDGAIKLSHGRKRHVLLKPA